MPFVESTPAPVVRENAERHSAKPAHPRARVSRGHAFAQAKPVVHLASTRIDLTKRATIELRAARARSEADAFSRLAVTLDPKITVEQRRFYVSVAKDAVERYQRQLDLLAHTDADRQRAEQQVGELRAQVADQLGILRFRRDEDHLLTDADVRRILAPPASDDALPSAATAAAQDQIDPPKVRRGLIDV